MPQLLLDGSKYREKILMLNLTTPANDPEKLATLFLLHILNIRREERFDRLTVEAAQVFDAPIALLSLASEYRQWCKAQFGFEVAVNQPAKTLKGIFCTQTSNTPLIVPDTLRDPAFAKNPMVRSVPFIRFYVGQPVISTAGEWLGTLCVIDHQPRRPKVQQLAALSELARRASQALEQESARLGSESYSYTRGLYPTDSNTI